MSKLTAWTVGKWYSLENKDAIFLGAVDGVNRFALAVDEPLDAFHFPGKEIARLEAIDGERLVFYGEAELPAAVPIKMKPVAIDAAAWLRFLFTTNPERPNAAFCPAGKLEELFQRRGIITGETPDLTLGSRYRALNPDYCLGRGGDLYRQTDLRENYPDLILKFVKFDRARFLAAGEFADTETIYLAAKSGETYGGTHQEFPAWQKKVAGNYPDYFTGATLATFKRVFAVRPDRADYFKELGIPLDAIILLRPAV